MAIGGNRNATNHDFLSRAGGTAAAIFLFGLAPAPALASSLNGGLLVLNESQEGALTVSGRARTEAFSFHINSNHESAVVGNGGAELALRELSVVGDVEFNGGAECTGIINTSAESRDDPFASLHEHVESAHRGADRGGLHLSGGHHFVEAGYYSEGIRISGRANVRFESGVFFLGGDGLQIPSGNSVGHGVTFVMLSGSLEMSGQSQVMISPPEEGPFTGVSVFQPAANTSRMSLSGGSSLEVEGVICAPGAHVMLTGSSSTMGQGPLFGDTLVADTVDLSGRGLIRIGRTPVTIFTVPQAALYD